MRLIEKLKTDIQPYLAKSQALTERPVGFHYSEFKSAEDNDYYTNHYIILMKSPCYDGQIFNNAVPIGTLYCLERALCAHLLAQGSFFRNDDRAGLAILNEPLYETVVLQRKNGACKTPTEYNDEFTDRFAEWIRVNDWQKDYPSYRFLHDILCKSIGRFHGIATNLASPKQAQEGFFISKYIRNPDEIHSRLQNFLKISKAIYDKIKSNRFNTIETQYGYKYRFDGVKRWFLDIEIVFGFQSGNMRSILRTYLEQKYNNQRGLFHSLSGEGGLPNIEGISLTSSAPDSTSKTSSDSKKSDFDSSNDDNLVSELNASKLNETSRKDAISSSSKSNSKSDSKSDPKSEALFESQGKSSTKSIRDSHQRLFDEEMNLSTEEVNHVESTPVSNRRKRTGRKLVSPSNQKRKSPKTKRRKKH